MISRDKKIMDKTIDYELPMFSVLVTICLGVLFSAWGGGIFFLVIGLIFWEIVYIIYNVYYTSNVKIGDYILSNRGAIMISSVFGWILGRTAIEYPLLDNNVPWK